MKLNTVDTRILRAAFAALAALFFLLVYRSERAVTAVIRLQTPAVEASSMPSGSGPSAYRALAQRDSLVAAARTGRRDPFLPAGAMLATTPRAVPANQPLALPEAPRIQAVLFDRTTPLVKLVLGERVSDWLRIGYVFQGWTIVDITESTVELHDKHRTVVLRAR